MTAIVLYYCFILLIAIVLTAIVLYYFFKDLFKYQMTLKDKDNVSVEKGRVA